MSDLAKKVAEEIVPCCNIDPGNMNCFQAKELLKARSLVVNKITTALKNFTAFVAALISWSKGFSDILSQLPERYKEKK